MNEELEPDIRVENAVKSILCKNAFILAAVLVACSPAFAGELSISGEPALATKAAVVAKLRLAPLASPTTTLAPVSASELARIRQTNRNSTKRTAIGIVRAIGSTRLPSATDLQWKAVSGGTAAQVAVSSPQAGAMRLAVNLAGVPDNVEMVIFGSDAPSRLEGPVRAGDIPDRTASWWTPVTDGDIQTIEFFVPDGIDASTLPIRITGVSHLFTTLATGMHKRVSEIGEAGSCNIDVKCSPLFPTLAFQNMRNAVAQMVMQDGMDVFLCTGQLLNDTDSSTQIPWFFSANHCFDNENPPYKTPAQIQTVASTLATLWFFEAVTCSHPSDPTVPSFVQLSGGSTYIYNNQPTDISMVRLNNAPPTGSFFAGWNANALAVGTAVVVAHHPEGDLKKVSQGNLIADSPFDGAGIFNEVHYTSGTTEPGSSGAGLFTFDGTQYQLRGALFGGDAACDDINGSDWYSQFDTSYSFLQPYLSPAIVPASNYTDLWYNAAESGWGLNIVQHTSNLVFAVWFTYAANGTNGTPMWYTLTNGSWTSTNTYAGQVFATTGPSAAAPTFTAANVVVRQAGTATLTFSDSSHGTFTYSVDGVSSSKAITRQPY